MQYFLNLLVTNAWKELPTTFPECRGGFRKLKRQYTSVPLSDRYILLMPMVGQYAKALVVDIGSILHSICPADSEYTRYLYHHPATWTRAETPSKDSIRYLLTLVIMGSLFISLQQQSSSITEFGVLVGDWRTGGWTSAHTHSHHLDCLATILWMKRIESQKQINEKNVDVLSSESSIGLTNTNEDSQ